MKVPKRVSADQILREVQIGVNGDTYRLVLWDTYRQRGTLGHSELGYALSYERAGSGEEVLIFLGEDYGCPQHRSVDADETIHDLLGFLSLKEGDTDAEYFSNYTPEQLEWRDNCAEDLSMWLMDAESMREENWNDDDLTEVVKMTEIDHFTFGV